MAYDAIYEGGNPAGGAHRIARRRGCRGRDLTTAAADTGSPVRPQVTALLRAPTQLVRALRQRVRERRPQACRRQGETLPVCFGAQVARGFLGGCRETRKLR